MAGKRTHVISVKLSDEEVAFLEAEVKRLEAMAPGLEASKGSVLRGLLVAAMRAEKPKKRP